jgi:hypothetical protein
LTQPQGERLVKISKDAQGSYKYSNVYKNHLTKLHSIQSEQALANDERTREHEKQVGARRLHGWPARSHG